MNKASVSVIIPSFNSTSTIERAVKSIANQSLLPKEVIIVDDCSTDERMEKVLRRIKTKYSDYFDFKILLNQSNKGPGVSRNAGWKVSNGEFIAFLDSDDSWHKQKIEIQYNYMINNPGVDFTCHKNLEVLEGQFESSEEILDDQQFNIESIKFKQLLYRNRIGTRTVMLKRSIENRFRQGKYHSEDYLLWLEVAASNYKIQILDVPLSKSYSHPFLGDGLSGSIIKMFKGAIDTY
uniref:glycosyltransferase family 2 protein n=1 Tax=Halobacillus sp. Marseille-Q1614 TaxID=2709134 RepID=UPI0015701F96